MKKLDKDKKFMLAIGIAALIIAAILVYVVISSESGMKPDAGLDVVSSEIKGNDASSDDNKDKDEKKEEEVAPGKAVYEVNDDTIHDSLLVYEIIEDAKTPQMKVVSYYDVEFAKLEIPSKVTYKDKEYTVTVIGQSAFESNSTMTEVIVPDTVERIDDSAFYSNALVKVTLSDSVKIIGNSVFAECVDLKEVKFGKGLKSIGDEVFSGCVAIESMSLPGSIESMGKALFYGCENMTKFTFEDGISIIGDEIFTNCYKLSEVVISESVVSIGKEVFWSCENLKSITIPSKVAVCGEGAFYSSGIENLIIKSAALQPSLDMIEGCDTLKVINVPESLVSAYKDCYKDEEFLIKLLS